MKQAFSNKESNRLVSRYSTMAPLNIWRIAKSVYLCPTERDKGHTLIDRRLYLPRSWAEERSKRQKGAIPEEIEFATKPQLAIQMLSSAINQGIHPAWFVADEVYGNDGSQAVVAREDC